MGTLTVSKAWLQAANQTIVDCYTWLYELLVVSPGRNRRFSLIIVVCASFTRVTLLCFLGGHALVCHVHVIRWINRDDVSNSSARERQRECLSVSLFGVCLSVCLCLTPEERPGGVWCLTPPCLESQGCQFDPTRYIYISSLVLLPNPVALSVLSFSAFGPFSWLLSPPPVILHFPPSKGWVISDVESLSVISGLSVWSDFSIYLPLCSLVLPSLSLFLSYPFLLLTQSPDPFFPNTSIFRKVVGSFVWLLVCLFFERLGDELAVCAAYAAVWHWY